MPRKLKIAVLALQGAFDKHVQMVKSLGAIAEEVRHAENLNCFDALILPGGESTTMSKQMASSNLLESIQEFAKTRPVFGTCAGLILMAKQVISPSSVLNLNLLDVVVERNAYGPQKESFSVDLPILNKISNTDIFPAFFIRAPKIRQHSPDVAVLASFEDEAVLVQQGNHLGCTFHPELSQDTSIHSYFLALITRD